MTHPLEVRNLRVDIDTAGGQLSAVRSVDMVVRRGETHCLVGESGSGKSLTALAIMGLLPRKACRLAERLQVGGVDLITASASQMRALRGDRMAMVFQEPMTSLNPSYTIGSQLIEVFRRHRGGPSARGESRAVELLERVGIASPRRRLDQYPHELSGGLRQRVMIAMALMCDPDLLIADEPTTALDVTVQAQILHMLKQIQRDLGLAMLFITHDLGIVARIADRVSVMYCGEIVETGPVGRVLENPLHPYTRALLRCLPDQAAGVERRRLASIPGIVPQVFVRPDACLFRERCSEAQPTRCARRVELVPVGEDRHCRCTRVAEVGSRLEAAS